MTTLGTTLEILACQTRKGESERWNMITANKHEFQVQSTHTVTQYVPEIYDSFNLTV